MNEIKFEPIGRTYPRNSQKKERYIKKLQHWLIIFAVSDFIFIMLFILVLWNEVIL